jgi:hypothetical protein
VGVVGNRCGRVCVVGFCWRVQRGSHGCGSAAVAQSVECVLGKDEVMGSSPISSFSTHADVPVSPARFVGRAAQLHVAGRLGFLLKSLVLLVNCRWSVGQRVCSRRVDSGLVPVMGVALVACCR